MDSRATLAKLTPPQQGEIYPCERLYKSFEQACERPAVWIAGAPGAGKTTLVAGWLEARKQRVLWYQLDAGDSDPAAFFHYLRIAARQLSARKHALLPRLTPEHLPSLGAFARRCFETLGASLPQPTMLVLDNYHEVAADSPLHALLAEALPLLPPHVTVTAISRAGPPPAFARLCVNRHIALLGADELALNADEVAGLARCLGHTQSHQDIAQLLHQTKGWAAGLVLLLEHGRDISGPAPYSDTSQNPPGQQLLFDYFAAEIFLRNTPDIREVLLKTALLPRITVTAARSLSGVTQSSQILDDLARQHYFTVRHAGATEDAYEYHPLFRAFLLNQASTHYSAAEFDMVRHDAAALLASQGDVETATRLYLDLQAWEEVTALILTHAPGFLEQGRHGTLRQWIAALPAARVDTDPWLKFAQAAATTPTDLAAARTLYAAAFATFKHQAEASGAYSAWGGIMETFIYRWSDFSALSPWIDELNALRLRHPDYPSATVEARVVGGMVNALMWSDPRHAVLRPWVERAEELLLDNNIPLTQRLAVANTLIFYRVWWLGDLASAVHILSTIKPLLRVMSTEPLPMLLWHVMESTYLAAINEHDECLRTVARGLQLAEDSGIHFFDAVLNGKGVYASLFAGDLGSAEDYLQRTHCELAPDAYLDIAHYHHQAAWIALCRGHFDVAREQLQVCARFAQKSGTPLAAVWVKHTLPHVLVESGAYSEALQHLDEILESIDTIQGNSVKFHCLLSRAYVSLKAGGTADALASLAQGLVLGKRQGYISPPWIGWRQDVMAELCAVALTHEIETEYVATIIQQRNLLPPANGEIPDRWPFRVKVYTLGHFSVALNDSPVEVTGKSTRKPLTLLKALIAFGGRDVNQHKLITALWPDADGDTGRKAFEIALHRLRKLLGADALVLKNAALSLDARWCWVDCWAFERLMSKLGSIASESEAARLLDHVFNLYQGPFLGRDEDLSCALPLQEQLRSRLLRGLLRVAERYENQTPTDPAERIYLRLIEIEPAVEESYRRLVRLYERHGRHADAKTCYRRCERVLHNMLSVPPSFALEIPGSDDAPISRPVNTGQNTKRP